MSETPRWGRCRAARAAMVLAALGALVAASATVSPTAVAAPGDQPKRSHIGKHDRDLIAAATASGAQTVTLLIAAAEGRNGGVVSGLQALGATVGKRDDDVSYLRAVVPTSRAKAAADLAGIVAADVDEVIPLPDPRPQGEQNPIPQPPPNVATPRNNPYMPVGETGAAQFTAANPRWDGRGTTIGIVDTGVDLDHPALATTTTGQRKITDWVTATEPLTDNDPTWVPMPDQVTGPAFSYQGVSYTAPAGTFRIGLFNERDPRLGGELGNDVNRDGNPPGSSGTFAVLWDRQNDRVRVDANQNRDFRDDPAMTDYARRFDVGHFGADNPDTEVREQMSFVVQIEKRLDVVNIGIVSGAHGSHVAGIAAANGMFGGAMSGAAPGARLKSVRACLFVAGCTTHALVEGMIYIAKHGDVDVINMSIGGLPSLNDGNNARAVLYDRLIDQYKVQMFISAGNNGSGLNTVGDPSVATTAMSVGSYVSQASWRANYGSDSAAVDNLHGFSSRGPREDGGFKPQVVAPGSAVSTTPLWQPGGPVTGTYQLPPGYSMLNGTSMAAPQSAGAGALLVSAARQRGVSALPAQIRQALNSSARFLPGYGAYEQGNGLIDVGGAWNLLRTDIKTVDVTSSVPVNTLLAEFLATPGIGVGIHDREGVTVGAGYTRTYTFTRTSGGGGIRNYNLSWVGNDGTFSTAATIALPKDTPTTLNVMIRPPGVGAHSAILNLDDPSTAGVDYQTMNTVVAADRFTAANGYTVQKGGTIGRNQTTSHFFAVPAGTPAFKVDLAGGGTAPGAGQIRFLRFHPYGVGLEASSSLSCYNPPVTPGGTCSGAPTSRAVSEPTAGVWEVTVEARRTSDAPSAPYTLTASVLGATVSPSPDVIPSMTAGIPVQRNYTLTNVFGAFTGRAVGTALGSALIGRPTIGHAEQQDRTVTVAPGSTSLRATIGSTGDSAADLDLVVFNCTTGTCVPAGQSADGYSEESVTIANPAPGAWLVRVVGFAVPAGSTQYDYVDVFVNAAFGAVSVTDANAPRPAGSSWNAPGVVIANAPPAAGRVLLGHVQARTDANVLVGSGDVIVESVTT